MSGKLNPVKLSWRHDGKYTDETAFDAAEFGGWQLELNGQPTVSVPMGWEVGGQYEAPIAALELPEGDYTARIRLVTSGGMVSDWSSSVEFEIRRVPSAPLDLAVS